MTHLLKNEAICFLCSILDEQTKAQRAIVYDSPAATKKVFDVCHAIQYRFKNIYVLTMARGQQQGTPKSFVATVKQTYKLPVVYARFDPLPLLTYMISAISLFSIIGRLIRKNKSCIFHILVYNRNWLYVPCLIHARVLGAKCYLDLEDGALIESSGPIALIRYSFLKFIFGYLCPHGSMLVTPGLITQVNTSNNIVCYGIAQQNEKKFNLNWHQNKLQFLLGGTLIKETGVHLLIDAVRILNQDFPSYKNSLNILITGHGPLVNELLDFARSEGKGWIDFKGRLTKPEYDELLNTSHVGLCLKLPSCEMGTTTFPSKVIEIAAQGMLVLTTNLKHINDLLGSDGANYLKDENPHTLANAIISILNNRDLSARTSHLGQQRILATCSPEKVANNISNLFINSLQK